MKTPVLNQPSTRFRSAVVRSESNAVNRKGGRFKAGLIKDVAVATMGEARGHDLWLDSEFIDSVVTEVNARPTGTKSRFTHPSLSDDGLGRFLGTIGNARRDGDVARADLHFSELAHQTPDGDLAEYVMGMAEKHPDQFGMSIVFTRDLAAEEAFIEQHGERSPDADNQHNYAHARLAELHAADAVDDPAANPDGLFHRDHIAQDADAFLSFALGLTEEAPALTTLDIEPSRVAGFVRKFVADHGLVITRKEPDMAKNKELLATTPDPQPEPAKPAEQEPTPAPAADPPKPAVSEPEPAPVQASAQAQPDPVAAERERCKAIAAQAAAFGLSGMAATLIEDGLSVSDAGHRLKDAKIQALSKLAPAPTPSADAEPAKQTGDTEEAWKAAWNQSATLRQEYLGNLNSYLALMRAKHDGREPS